MAARLRLSHQEDIRKKIQADRIIDRLQRFLHGENDDQTNAPVQLTELQVKVGLALLGKALADPPQQSWVSGPDDEPLVPGTVIFQGVEPVRKPIGDNT